MGDLLGKYSEMLLQLSRVLKVEVIYRSTPFSAVTKTY